MALENQEYEPGEYWCPHCKRLVTVTQTSDDDEVDDILTLGCAYPVHDACEWMMIPMRIIREASLSRTTTKFDISRLPLKKVDKCGCPGCSYHKDPTIADCEAGIVVYTVCARCGRDIKERHLGTMGEYPNQFAITIIDPCICTMLIIDDPYEEPTEEQKKKVREIYENWNLSKSEDK